MHVIIVGCGRVGSGLAHQLKSLGHSIAIIDKDERSFRRLSDDYEWHTVVGFGFDRDVLSSANAMKADALAAVTSGDNSNILCARIARETFSIENVVARIYDPRRAEIYQRLGIPTVATVAWTIDQVLRRLIPEELSPVWVSPDGELELIEQPIPYELVGKTVGSLDVPSGTKIVGISRNGKSGILEREVILQEGDLIYILASKNTKEEALNFFS